MRCSWVGIIPGSQTNAYDNFLKSQIMQFLLVKNVKNPPSTFIPISLSLHELAVQILEEAWR